jgi:hypothetical protein
MCGYGRGYGWIRVWIDFGYGCMDMDVIVDMISFGFVDHGCVDMDGYGCMDIGCMYGYGCMVTSHIYIYTWIKAWVGRYGYGCVDIGIWI